MFWTSALAAAISYEDIRELARRRLPKVVFDSIDGGAGAETTLAANVAAFEHVSLLPRQANAPQEVDLSIEILGQRLKTPVLLAPCGSARIVHPDGEKAVAKAAAEAGCAYIVPHLAGTSAQEIRDSAEGPLWYQIYLYGGRAVAEPALNRAWAAGYRVLVVTIENARTRRERDARNGMADLLSGSIARMMRHAPQLLVRPSWLADFLADGAPTLTPNAMSAAGAMGPREIAAAAVMPDASFRWADFEWLRAVWPGPILAKGVLTGADARRAVEVGAAGVIVSNHGGRVMDGFEPSLRALPDVVDAVGASVPVLLDSGVRRAGDVIKATCLGARAVLIGRPYMMALAHGQAGVARMLAILEEDLRAGLASMGASSFSDLRRDMVRAPPDWRFVCGQASNAAAPAAALRKQA